MGKHVRSIGVLAVAGTLLLGVGACAAPAASTGTTPGTTASAAPAPTTTAVTTTPAAAARPLAQVFPNVDDATCTADSSQRTGTGAVPVEAYTCGYSAVAAGAEVIFAQWPDQAGAQAWYQDTVDIGPRIEENVRWTVGGVEQGDLYTAQNPNNVVISTGVYDDLPYTWEIRTSTLDESNTIFGQLRFTPATEIG
ncbi:hypothetical protein ACVGOW_05235 [Pseudonocardia saturnea]